MGEAAVSVRGVRRSLLQIGLMLRRKKTSEGMQAFIEAGISTGGFSPEWSRHDIRTFKVRLKALWDKGYSVDSMQREVARWSRPPRVPFFSARVA